ITGQPFATRSEVIAPEAMAATSHPLATQIALDTLRRGGSAMDAAIAANAALGLMEPTGNGIGGDLFAIVWDPKTRKLYGYNGSGRSPRALTLAWFQENGYTDIPPHGPRPVTVPGTVDAWFALHGRFGRLPMREVLQPTIDYARKGHPVHETIAYYWGRSVPVLSQWPGFADQFTIDCRTPRQGARCRNPHLPNTLSTIAPEGRDAFHNGATPTSPTPWKPSAARAGMPSTRARSPAASTPTSATTAASCATRTWPRTRASGWNRSAPPTAASRSGSCRPTARASPPCRCSTSLRATTSRRFPSAAPSTCTCSSRPRSWPSPTAPAGMPTRTSSPRATARRRRPWCSG